MSPDEKELITTGFKNLNEKIDLIIHPVKQDVVDLKSITNIHTEKINILELFKEGHQIHHMENKEFASEKKNDRKFYWEIIAGSGVIAGLIAWLNRAAL